MHDTDEHIERQIAENKSSRKLLIEEHQAFHISSTSSSSSDSDES